MVCIGVGATVLYLQNYGYLPSPFFHFKSETFMDWYNPAYWAHHAGIYSVARSVYPPLSFDFLRLFSAPSCYTRSGIIGRGCDILGFVTITIFLFINLILAMLIFWREGQYTALPRALAISLGSSMLYGWERGNLVLPCFTAFMLAYGAMVRSASLRALLAAVAVNFKPYLLILPVTQALRRDWPGVIRFSVACLGVYLVSFVILRAGSPFELARDAFEFLVAHGDNRYGIFQFTTTYDSLLALLGASVPLRLFLGETIVGLARVVLPTVMALGAAGATLCLLGAVVRPGAVDERRLAAIGLSLMFVFGSPGAYALVFLLFLVFLEPWRGAGRIIALIGAYLWCVPWDFNLAPVLHETTFSFLSGRPVRVELFLTLGELIRPGLVLMIQFGLVAASIPDLRRALRRQPAPTGVAAATACPSSLSAPDFP